MNLLPNELILEIFNHIIKITDKRQFLRTCVMYNTLTKTSMYNYELNYTCPYFINKLKYGVEKFPLELCHDGYFELIPEHYINPANEHLVRFLSIYNNLGLLKLAKKKGCKISKISSVRYLQIQDYYCQYDERTCALVAENGHLSILKFLLENGCRYNLYAYSYAVENGHLDILKYLHEDSRRMNKFLYKIALSKGHMDMINWMEGILM